MELSMLTDPYATASQYRSIVAKIDEGSDAEIELALAAISRYLDRKLRHGASHFGQTESVQTRTYRAGRTQWLVTDDLPEAPDAVTSGSASLAGGTDYAVWPRNALQAADPRPYEGLFLARPRCGDEIAITARWGWPAVPRAIHLATIELTAIWRLETPRATERMNELDQVVGTSEMANRLVADLLDKYARKEWVVA
jgi:hypothetical protein